MNRKAMSTFSFLLGAIIIIVLLVIVINVVSKAGTDTNKILDCPGECSLKETGCTSPRVPYTFKSCSDKDGQPQICCATPLEITGGGSGNANTGTGTTGTGDPNTTLGRGIIEIRMNDDASPVSLGTTKKIKEKEETQFHFWVQGGPAKKCSAKFLDESGKTITTGPFSQKVDVTNCLGAENKQTLSIIPIYEDLRKYKLQVLLYGDKADSEEDALEGSWIFVTVEKVCPTKCEEITTAQECTTPSMVEGCVLLYPTFDCEWDITSFSCKTR